MSKVEGHRTDAFSHIPLEAITVGERFREDFGDIEELKESIRDKGIIQPITIDSNYTLLAGGRRYRAATELGLPTIPALIREFVDEVDSREIELMENLHRKDFTWAEKAKLTARIDALFREKNNGNWSIRKTAEVSDSSKSAVARELELARAIEAVPELAEFKTADEALKVLKKMEEQAVVAELHSRQKQRLADEGRADAKVVGGQLEAGLRTLLKLADKNYIVSDVFAGMSGLKDNGHINLIECDPPYGIDLNSQKGSADSAVSTVHSYEEVSRDEYPGFLKRLASELYRVAGKDCWLVFWYGPTWHHQVLTSLREAGWQVDEIPAIWAKPQGQTLQPELYFARGYEPFFLCRKGKPLMIERGRLNVFNFSPVPPKQKYHPTQRPLELVEHVFSCLAAGRANVFVPFLGSGASLLACYNLGFTGFGFDLNGEYKPKFMLEAEAQARKLFDVDKGDD
jgi:ParB family chromosome partitioning protein